MMGNSPGAFINFCNLYNEASSVGGWKKRPKIRRPLLPPAASVSTVWADFLNLHAKVHPLEQAWGRQLHRLARTGGDSQVRQPSAPGPPFWLASGFFKLPEQNDRRAGGAASRPPNFTSMPAGRRALSGKTLALRTGTRSGNCASSCRFTCAQPAGSSPQGCLNLMISTPATGSYYPRFSVFSCCLPVIRPSRSPRWTFATGTAGSPT